MSIPVDIDVRNLKGVFVFTGHADLSLHPFLNKHVCFGVFRHFLIYGEIILTEPVYRLKLTKIIICSVSQIGPASSPIPHSAGLVAC